MNLRSRKTRQDIINKLPDEILTRILSLLPDSDANRTRILSNRWKNLYAFLPNLHFVMPSYPSVKQLSMFHDFIDQTLAIRDGMPIGRFFLDSSLKCDFNRFYPLLCTVVEHKVQHLELRFPNNLEEVRFCWDLFKTCDTLVQLTLNGRFVLDVPKEAGFLFPCLKKMELVLVAYSSEQSFSNLISGCPDLEELSVEREHIGQFDKVDTCMISSPSLKKLKICFSSSAYWKYKVVIDAPDLEHLYISDDMHIDYSLTKEPLSLVEAHINNYSESVVQFITHLSSAKILTLAYPTIVALSSFPDLNMPMFPNLVKLVIGIEFIWNFNLLLVLLNNMPNLEHITIPNWLGANIINAIRLNLPVDPPACVCYKLKDIIIHDLEGVRFGELTLIRYLLEHSNNLETLTINAHHIDPKRRAEVLNFHRGSNMCRVEFVKINTSTLNNTRRKQKRFRFF